MLLISCFLLIGAAFAAPPPTRSPLPCPLPNVTLTPAGYQLPPTPMNSYQSCIAKYTVPAGYYANLYIRLTSSVMNDYFHVYDNIGDSARLTGSGQDDYATIEQTTNYPTDFFIDTQLAQTNMSVQLSIQLRPATPKANVVSTVQLKKNGQPSLIYFEDFKANTSYTFTAETNVVVEAAPVYSNGNCWSPCLQNAFIYDGDSVASTLNFAYQRYVSKGQTVTIYMAEKTPIKGAILVTDYSNIKDLFEHHIQYVPIDVADHTSFLVGDGYNGQTGAVTVIGEKDGSTPIVVRTLTQYGGGAPPTVSALPGGPTADFSKAVQLSPNKLPQQFGGNVNTFYVSGGTGGFKYSIGQN